MRCGLSRQKRSDGRAFVWMVAISIRHESRAQYLLRTYEIAAVVTGRFQRGVALGHYELRAWFLMANQSVLLTALIAPSGFFAIA